MKTKHFYLFLFLVSNNVSLLAAHIWPIIMDQQTFDRYQPYIASDFRHNGIDNNMYIWEETYVDGGRSGLNFYGLNESYLSLNVASLGWSGFGYSIQNASSLTGMRALKDSIIANPSNYYLHIAIKSRTNGSHEFYTFGNNATAFNLGTAVIYEGQVVGDFPRDGLWHEFYIPLSAYVNAISQVTIQSGTNILCVLSGSTKNVELDLDAVYFCDADMMNLQPGIIEQQGIRYSFNPQEHTVSIITPLNTSCEEITIPKQIKVNRYTYPVTEIEAGAFSACSQLKTVIVESTTPPTLNGQNVFPTNINIYVPCEAIELYQTEWSAYAQVSYTPIIYPYNITLLPSEHGDVVHPMMVCDEFITLTAAPNFGYHFVQWNDGNTDNPRVIQLTKDTTFSAIFSMDISGTCGKDYALSWNYDSIAQKLTIQGNGAFNEHMECGVINQKALSVIISEGVTEIGVEAFKECNVRTLTLPTTLKTIGTCAFYNCVDLTTIYNYRERPCQLETSTFEGVNKFDCTLYVPEASIDMYKSSGSNWRDFYYILALESVEAIDNISVESTYIQKILIDGQILILRGDKIYTLQGKEVR